jgi:hypothetical protein
VDEPSKQGTNDGATALCMLSVSAPCDGSVTESAAAPARRIWCHTGMMVARCHPRQTARSSTAPNAKRPMKIMAIVMM